MKIRMQPSNIMNLKYITKTLSKTLILALVFLLSSAQRSFDGPIDLWHWKLELPNGYKASDWKLSNFQNDRFSLDFFHLDPEDNSLVMKAYPAEGTSKAKYTRCTLREQMQAGSNDVNWTMKEGGVLQAEFKVDSITKNDKGQYHKTILFQIDGRTTAKQTKQLGLSKPTSLPMIKIYWQDGYLKVVRKILKDDGTAGDALLSKSSWKEGDTRHSRKKIGFEKTRIRLEVKRGKVFIQINDEKPIVYRDLSTSQWYFENYFTAGNYLQSKESNCYSSVKYYSLEVTHSGKK